MEPKEHGGNFILKTNDKIDQSPVIQQILKDLRGKIPSINAPELFRLKNNFTILDCREQEEVELGIIPDSIWIPKAKVDLMVEKQLLDKTKPIVVYCASGVRSLLVAKTLLELGYLDVQNLDSGIEAWKSSGLKISQRTINKINRRRYKAQLTLPEVGEDGQMKISQAKVLLVGCGGLGSPTAFYLAAAGVGTLGLADDDLIDESNLQRQILHSTQRIGMAKVESAFMVLKDLNPLVNIVPHKLRVSSENIDQLLCQYDIIIDGCDNFETRYLVNQACLKNRKVNIHGSVFAFQGQVSVFCTPDGPCYECLFPEPPGKDVAPNCAEGGVLGAVVGVTGSLVAVETIKWILGLKSAPMMHCYDGLHASFESLKIKKEPSCKSCSISPEQIIYNSDFITECKVG